MTGDPIVTVKLSGDKDIVAAFADLRDYMPRSAMRTAVRKAAQYMAQFIALVAPKLTGRLASNIAVKTTQSAHTMRGRVVVNTAGKVGGSQNAWYWRFLELGFHTKSGAARRFPFVQGVVEAKTQAAAQVVIDACGAAIDRAERKAAKAKS